MLILTRKLGEGLIVGDDIIIKVVKKDNNQVKLGIAVLAYERNVSNPSLCITILGGILATAGLVWLVVTRLPFNRN